MALVSGAACSPRSSPARRTRVSKLPLKKSVSKPSSDALASLAIWKNAIKESADPARVSAVLLQLSSSDLADPLRKLSAEQARILAAVFSGSQVLTAQLQTH